MVTIALIDPIGTGAAFKTAAHELGYKSVVVYTKSFSFYQTQYHLDKQALFAECDEVIVSDNRDEIFKQLKALSIQAVIPASEAGVEIAEWLIHSLDLWGNPFELSIARRDKRQMRKHLQKSGLSCPAFAVCDAEEKVIRFAQEHSFPLVIKTPKGFGTSHVYMCNDMKSLQEGFKNIYGKEDCCGERAQAAIVEEFIGGDEYIVDTFSDGEKIHITDIWRYEKIQSESFKNIYYNCISIPLHSPSIQKLAAYGKKIAELFQIERGPAHIEIKDDPVKGCTLIEIGARAVGSRLPFFLKKYTSFDLFQETIRVCLHGKTTFPEPFDYDDHFALAFCPVFQQGKVKAISEMEAIQQLASYDDHFLSLKVGDAISPTTYLGSTPLLVWLANKNRADLLRDVARVHDLFNVDVAS